MHTVMVWAESEDRSGSETGLAGISDQLFVVSGDTIEMPARYPYISMIYCTTESATYHWIRGRLTAPSITQRPFLLTAGYANGATLNPENVYDWRHSPVAPGHPHYIEPGDKITAYSYEEDEAGVAHTNAICVVVADGIIPIGLPPKPPILHQCTTGAVSSNLTWETLSLTEAYALQPGTYRMWGADVVSATAIAARFIFPGNDRVGRPCVIPRRNESNPIHPFNFMWGSGIEFKMPGGLPKLEIICESAETPDWVTLFLEKVD